MAERGAEFCDLVMNCCELKDVLDLVFLKLDESVREGTVEFLEFLKNTKAQDSHLNHAELMWKYMLLAVICLKGRHWALLPRRACLFLNDRYPIC
jgi:hypothetical protein